MGGGTNHMTTSTTMTWESKRTPETRAIEDLLRKSFDQADYYRYNSASIRIRVIDRRFEGMPREKRDALVEEQINKLPPETQREHRDHVRVRADGIVQRPDDVQGVYAEFGVRQSESVDALIY